MKTRQIIVSILDNVFNNGAYSNIELNKHLNSEEINSKDRALITEVVYGTIKHKGTIDVILSNYVKEISLIDKEVINILRSAIYQMRFLDRVPDYAVVNEAVNLSKEVSQNSSRFVNGVLRNYIRNESKNYKQDFSKIDALCFDYSFEKWMIHLFITQYGEEKAIEILKGLNHRPNITVRVNALKGDYDEVYEMLENAEYDVEEGALCPDAIKINKGSNIENNPLFNDGYITVQDESAMMVASLFELNKNDRVMDLCSAPGGKTTHIAELLENEGEVLAFDIHEHKLKLIEEHASRLGLTNIKTDLMDATKVNGKFVNYATKVLIDVPCSGLGIIRKKPEIKWNKKAKELRDLVEIQRNIMENSWEYLNDGGELVYSTCTLNKRENEDNIDWFVEKHRNARVEKIFIGNADNIINNSNGSVTILPNENMDGFFIAKLKKCGR